MYNIIVSKRKGRKLSPWKVHFLPQMPNPALHEDSAMQVVPQTDRPRNETQLDLFPTYYTATNAERTILLGEQNLADHQRFVDDRINGGLVAMVCSGASRCGR
jgi:hypothetical protein